jgi:WD40 repeat protein
LAKSSSETFLAGSADGRVFTFETASAKAIPLEGDGHTNFVSGLATSDAGTFSVGFDDKLREVDVSSNSFTYVPHNTSLSFLTVISRPAALATSSQPKAIAVASDSTVFIAEAQGVEAIRSNQKVHELKTSFTTSMVAARDSVVAVGGEDQKVRLYSWDGTTLRETNTLEGNRGIISALAFSPDGKYLVSGDVSLSPPSSHEMELT